jgi:hypothetical protein
VKDESVSGFRPIVKRSGHNIQLDQPEIVVNAVRDVVEAVRHPRTWKTP